MNDHPDSLIQANPEGESLRLLFPERIESENAASVREVLFQQLAEYPHTEVIADFDRVDYISSSGLRVILELIRKEKNLRIIRVGTVAYEVFEMTGFLEMGRFEKKRRKISLEGAKKIGDGFNSDVYQLNGDTIIKVYRKEVASIEHIEMELKRAKQAFVSGISTAISFDIVDVGDTCGVVFERMNGSLLRDALVAEPERFGEYMDQYIHVIQKMNATPVMDPTVPDAKEIALNKVKFLKTKYLSAAEAEHLEHFLREIPDTGTYVHGDCHAKNIMLNNGELMLIDMEMISKGSPLFELGSIYSTYIVFSELIPGNSMAFHGMPYELCKNLVNTILERCLPKDDPDEYARALKAIQILGCLACTYTCAFFEEDFERREPGCVEKAVRFFRETLAAR